MIGGTHYALPGSGWMVLHQLQYGPTLGKGGIMVNGAGIERTCSGCGETKSLSAFAKEGLAPDGTQRYKSRCRECVSVQRIAWERKRAEKRARDMARNDELAGYHPRRKEKR